ncbi:hypothetical protein Pfo_016292 [Paulownia fortunei]|nr:hypothetical protein Pfo_016292 [Paulownia fortunei]
MAIEEDRSNIPTDIIQTILSRLSVKTLVRFRTVSKSWNTMISDPGFVRIHLQQSKCSNSQNLFLRKYPLPSREGFSLVKLEGRKFQTETILNCPNGWDAVLCSCDCVLLVTDFSYRTYMLWNPSSQTKTMFWFPYRFYEYPMKHGICHDPTIDDFKVVIASGKYYAVFSCKNKSWTKKKEFSYSSGTGTDSGLFVDGAIYWVSTHKNVREIIYFDPRDDEFKMLQKPKHVKDSDEFFLVCLRGCLCLYCKTGDETMVQFWMKEKGRDMNSWNELMTIENVQTPLSLFKPLYFVENKILIRLEGARFLVYSPFEKTFEEFEESDLLNVRLIPCLGSLFFPLKNTRPKRKRTVCSQLS